MEQLHMSVISEILEEKVPKRPGRSNPRGVKKKMGGYQVCRPLGFTKVMRYTLQVGTLK